MKLLRLLFDDEQNDRYHKLLFSKQFKFRFHYSESALAHHLAKDWQLALYYFFYAMALVWGTAGASYVLYWLMVFALSFH